MMRTTRLSILFVATALGCASPLVDDDDDEAGVSSTAETLRDDGTTFFVYANHRICVTAPCPSYTVITPGGVRFEVARVIVDPGAERAHRLLDDFIGPLFVVHVAALEMHPLDTAERNKDLKRENGLGYFNITKGCTKVCAEGITITDNAIIPLKERVIDQLYDPIAKVFRVLRGGNHV